MTNDRRNFLKLLGLSGAGILTGGASALGKSSLNDMLGFKRPKSGHFNMSGYAAPELEKVRIGFIGLGNRGPDHLRQLIKIDGVEINGLCDLRPEKANEAKKLLETTDFNPQIYTGNENAWKKLCEQKDLDLIYIATPWYLHASMAVYAMEHGKHVAVEVPSAITLEECWQLVETSEHTRRHCMILENCCYDFFELLTLNMARQGVFGEIIHGEGAYIHDLLQGNFAKNKYWDMWRLKQNATRNGNLYPTHGLGPISQIMNINRGDKMDYMVSMSGNDFMMGPLAKKLAAKDNFYKPYVNKKFSGNINTSFVRTSKGRTILIQHDVTSPRAYSRIHLVSGTKATAQKYPLPGRIALVTKWNSPEEWRETTLPEWLSPEEYKPIEERYTPEIVKRMGKIAKEVGGHGGMDFLMNWRLIDCLRNGLPLDIDVYDTATWSAIGPLSEKSVASRSASINVPDFTSGFWKNNEPVDVFLKKGGNTQVKI